MIGVVSLIFFASLMFAFFVGFIVYAYGIVTQETGDHHTGDSNTMTDSVTLAPRSEQQRAYEGWLEEQD